MSTEIPQQLSHLFANINNYILSKPFYPNSKNSDPNQSKSNKNQSHMISLEEFWTTTRLCVTLQEFEEMLVMIGYFMKDSERKKLIEDGVQLINLQNVLNGVQEWKWVEEDITKYLAKMSLKNMKDNSKSSQEINQRNAEGGYFSQKMFNNFSPQLSTSYYYKNFSTNRNFLNEHLARQQKNKLKLMNTLRRVDNQYDYQITVKVGQTNDICKKLKNGMSYILNKKIMNTVTGGNFNYSMSRIKSNISKRQLETLTIIQCSKDGKQKEIKMFEFQSKYKQYKQNSMNLQEEFEGSIEEDLKKVLVEVMCLRSQMEEQLSLLQRKGVSS